MALRNATGGEGACAIDVLGSHTVPYLVLGMIFMLGNLRQMQRECMQQHVAMMCLKVPMGRGGGNASHKSALTQTSESEAAA